MEYSVYIIGPSMTEPQWLATFGSPWDAESYATAFAKGGHWGDGFGSIVVTEGKIRGCTPIKREEAA